MKRPPHLKVVEDDFTPASGTVAPMPRPDDPGVDDGDIGTPLSTESTVAIVALMVVLTAIGVGIGVGVVRAIIWWAR